MPIRFSTVAANADVLGEDTPADNDAPARPHAEPADTAPRHRFDRPRAAERRSTASDSGDAKSGKDINAAGFIKDKDAGKP